jgi:hypothetical protein
LASNPPSKRREVRRTDLFESQARSIQPDAQRLDAQIRSVVSALQRAADLWPPAPGTKLRVVKTDPFPHAPRLRIFFTIDDDDDCTMRFIELMEGPAAEEDLEDL